MKQLLTSIQDHLEAGTGLAYVDENWGQLDYYSTHPPVAWPCALLDIDQAQYTNTGIDKQQKPQNRQRATLLIKLTIGDQKLGNTSARAPQTQKESGFEIWDTLQQVHEALQGFAPLEWAGRMSRSSMQRIKREDGIQEYEVYYRLEMGNV